MFNRVVNGIRDRQDFDYNDDGGVDIIATAVNQNKLPHYGAPGLAMESPTMGFLAPHDNEKALMTKASPSNHPHGALCTDLLFFGLHEDAYAQNQDSFDFGEEGEEDDGWSISGYDEIQLVPTMRGCTRQNRGRSRRHLVLLVEDEDNAHDGGGAVFPIEL
jgi:hypothetical protein